MASAERPAVADTSPADTTLVTTATRAPQLCRANPAASPLTATFQCHAEPGTRVRLRRGGRTVPGTRACGKAALWRIAPPPGHDANQAPMAGWCTPHAAEVLRERMRQQCPERAPLAAARAAAVQVVADPDTGTDDPRDWAALRKANTALSSHDRTHKCLI